MHNNSNQKHHIPSLLIVICVILFSALSLLFRKDVQLQKEQVVPIVQEVPIVAQPKLSHCGLTINTPLTQDVISFPYTLTASWKNDKETTGCNWTVFEAQLAVVTVFDGNNKKVASGLLTVAGETDWMNGQPFDAQADLQLVDPKTALVSGTNLMFVIDEENPSGGKNAKQMRIPVVVK